MDKVIVTGLLVIASVTGAVLVITTILPSISSSGQSVVSAQREAADRIRTSIEIIAVSSNADGTQIDVWVKNVGTQVIRSVESSDIIIIKPGGVLRLPYVSGCASECWDYTLEDNESAWSTAVTVKFTVTTTVATGNYSVSVAAPNGVTAAKDFSV